ncbi:MAG: S9 family peptidase [Rhodoglobus sp.]
MKASDLGLLRSVSAPALHPTGDRAVVSMTHPHLGSDANVGQLWTVPLDGSGAHRLTRGKNDGAPSWSPDGHAIAFVREAGGAGQLFIVDAHGGEAIQLTDQKQGIEDFRWSDDSTRIAFVARVAEAGRYGTVEGIAAGAEPARRMTGLNYKANGLGYTIDRPAQLFIVTVPAIDVEPDYKPAPLADGSKVELELAPEALQLTHGSTDVASPRFLEHHILYVTTPPLSTDLRDEIWTVATDGESEPQLLTGVDANLSIESVDVAPDGTKYLLAQDMGDGGLDFVARNSALYRLDESGPTRLTDPETIDLTGSQVTALAGKVLVHDRTRGRVRLIAVTGDGGVEELSTGDVEILGHAASAGPMVVTFATPETFGDVGILADGVLTPLTDFSAELRATGIVDPVELTVAGRDGYDVHGWMATPTGEGPHPTLLMIHGGPYADYGVHLFDEVQVYTDAGYAVVFCNPRGSAGYGQAHGRAIRGAMGTVDLSDVLDFLDGALDANSSLDRERLGILGGSYGGYLTAWTIAHDHRFKGAIVERGFLAPESFVGSSDIGWFFGQEYTGTEPEQIRAQSPQAVALQVKTPTLVIHSENDLRCPLGQAETWYATVKLNGVEAELLVFPGENHELSRSGRPRHRLQRFDAILDWFGRHL